jgi:hypothetical protein
VSVCSSLPVFTFHILIVLSYAPEARINPPEEKATELIPSEWPVSDCSSLPVLTSQSLIVLLDNDCHYDCHTSRHLDKIYPLMIATKPGALEPDVLRRTDSPIHTTLLATPSFLILVKDHSGLAWNKPANPTDLHSERDHERPHKSGGSRKRKAPPGRENQVRIVT